MGWVVVTAPGMQVHFQSVGFFDLHSDVHLLEMQRYETCRYKWLCFSSL